MESVDFQNNSKIQSQKAAAKNLVDHVRQVVTEYLKRRPHLSVNGISKKCNVSEPTLRRIMSNKVKTTPQITTLLDILTYVSNTTSVREIVKMYPGPIADHLTEVMPYLEEFDQEYSNSLNDELKDPVKYLIYKLAVNHSGVKEQKIVELYGNHGVQMLNDMVEKGFITRGTDRLCKANSMTFSTSHDDFVRNFKLVADFIKPDKLKNRKPLNPFFNNTSDSITAEAYERIRRIQAASYKKICKVLAEDQSKGTIPFFYISAIDSLDLKSPAEWVESEQD